jgi:hypothetical protein
VLLSQPNIHEFRDLVRSLTTPAYSCSRYWLAGCLPYGAMGCHGTRRETVISPSPGSRRRSASRLGSSGERQEPASSFVRSDDKRLRVQREQVEGFAKGAGGSADRRPPDMVGRGKQTGEQSGRALRRAPQSRAARQRLARGGRWNRTLGPWPGIGSAVRREMPRGRRAGASKLSNCRLAPAWSPVAPNRGEGSADRLKRVAHRAGCGETINSCVLSVSRDLW